MKDSVTYQAILEEGAIRGLQELIVLLGRKKVGVLSPQTETTVQGITDLDRLRLLTDRLFDVSSWEELLAAPE